jgi:hypothetical protein
MKRLALIREEKLFRLIPGRTRKSRLEASGVALIDQSTALVVFDSLNLHDIITGSRPDGRAFTDAADHTCQNYTSNNVGHVELGHHDRTGGGPGRHTVGNSSWNSSHESVGCSQASFAPGGGAALFYCFAAQ